MQSIRECLCGREDLRQLRRVEYHSSAGGGGAWGHSHGHVPAYTDRDRELFLEGERLHVLLAAARVLEEVLGALWLARRTFRVVDLIFGTPSLRYDALLCRLSLLFLCNIQESNLFA